MTPHRHSEVVQTIGGRATAWQLRTRTLEFGPLPLWMGIVNVTPDSFSDGGRYLAIDTAVEHALQLVAEGADLIDIGGESTRPDAIVVDEQEELRRVVPVIARLAARTSVPISIDTSKAAIARASVDAGAEIINDVTALTGDRAMIEVALQSRAGVCAMHMPGNPRTMQQLASYGDVVSEVRDYLATRRAAIVGAGVELGRLCLDPGIGFGKSHADSATLMGNCWRFHELGSTLLVGHSRKGFLGKLLGDSTTDRAAATAGSAVALALQGVQVMRVHDVAVCRQAMLAFAGCGGFDLGIVPSE